MKTGLGFRVEGPTFMGSGYVLGSVNYFKAWYTQLFRSEWSSTWTSVVSLGFNCRHRFSVCKTDLDQTRELWWCKNLLVSYLILFVECRHYWCMTWLKWRNALPTVYLAGTLVRRSITYCPVQHIPFLDGGMINVGDLAFVFRRQPLTSCCRKLKIEAKGPVS